MDEVRSVLRLGLLWLLVSTGNPFFGVLLVVVLIGVGLTGTSYVLDRREAARATSVLRAPGPGPARRKGD